MANFPPYQYQSQMVGYGQQMQPYYQVQQPQQAQEQLFCRPATNFEEVQAYPVDFSGRPMTFHGPGLQKIWIKAFDPNTGGSVVAEYHKATAAEPAKPAVPTMEDFQGLKATVMDLQDEVTRLRSMRRRATKETEVSEDA